MSSGLVLPLGHWGFCYFSKPNHQERAFCRANTGKKTRDLRVVALALDYLNCSAVLGGIQPGSLKGVGKSLPGACLEARIFTCQPVVSRPILGCGGGGGPVFQMRKPNSPILRWKTAKSGLTHSPLPPMARPPVTSCLSIMAIPNTTPSHHP